MKTSSVGDGSICADALEQGARSIADTLRAEGFTVYWAGGCVRDRLLGRPPQDIDIVTSARPEQIEALFPKTFAVGKAFGVMGVPVNGQWYEVATFRTDAEYRDGRRPVQIAYADPRADALRRDFTVNALFYDPATDRIIDYVGGQQDLAARCLRAVGDPAARFGEDHLRMLRAVRLAGALDFEIEPATRAAIAPLASCINRISPERVRDELMKMAVTAQRPGDTLQCLYDTGLLAVILPEVAAMVGVEQPPQYHPEGDVFTHTRLMWAAMPRERSPEFAMAVLLHDVGKPPTAKLGRSSDGSVRVRFDGHDRVGAAMTETILRRLRCSNVFIQTVAHIVRNHMRFMHVREMRRAKLRTWVATPTFELELELHRLDCLASSGDLKNYHFMRDVQAALAAEPSLPAPLLNGHDLLRLGLPAGPEIGHWLKRAYAHQLDHDITERELLLQWLCSQPDVSGDVAPMSKEHCADRQV